MVRLKVGDKVLYNQKEHAIIVKDISQAWLGSYEYEIQFIDSGAKKRAKIGELELIAFALPTMRGKTSNGCTCGAWATSYPNIHSDWCIKHRK